MRLLKAEALLRAWCYWAPLAVARATASPELSPSLESSPEPQPDFTGIPQLNPQPEPAQAVDMLVPRIIPAVPAIMGWIGSIGGLLGIVSFTDSYMTKLIKFLTAKPPPPTKEELEAEFKEAERAFLAGKEFPKKVGEAPWKIAIQVGLDGTGLKGAGGDFPQICLWNRHGELIGYNDQTIRLMSHDFQNPYTRKFNFEIYNQDTPQINPGGLTTLGIWPAPGHEDRREQQATYVTMIKRHFDAICVASVFLHWPDSRTWLFDGTWGQASNMSWYYSYVYTADRKDDGTCFWLDHRGTLKHAEDLEEEYIGAHLPKMGRKPNKYYPSHLWAANVVPETGIPEGDDLNDGMRENGVHEYKVPLGVKFHAPAFWGSSYGDNFDNLTVFDFVTNPAKMTWIMEPSRMNVRGGNPVLPLLHPRSSLSDKDPELIWEDVYNQKIPADCMTDFYYNNEERLIVPGSDRRCVVFYAGYCFDRHQVSEILARRASVDGPAPHQPLPSLQERHARTLVNDQNSRSEGSSTKKLCENPHSVGPSYSNHRERLFCRMTDKTLWPFCDIAAGVSHDCFDSEAEVLVEKNKPIGKRSHHWDAIEDWDSGERIKRAA